MNSNKIKNMTKNKKLHWYRDQPDTPHDSYICQIGNTFEIRVNLVTQEGQVSKNGVVLDTLDNVSALITEIQDRIQGKKSDDLVAFNTKLDEIDADPELPPEERPL